MRKVRFFDAIAIALLSYPLAGTEAGAESQCAKLKADYERHDRAWHDHEEHRVLLGAYDGWFDPNWCQNAKTMIEAYEDIIAILTHDPNKCGRPQAIIDARQRKVDEWRRQSLGCDFESAK